MKFIFSAYHFLLALIGSIYYRFPSEALFVVGVTGTKGKSTVLDILSSILERHGERTAVLTSVRRKVGEKNEINKTGNTMPGRFAIQQFLREAVRAHCTVALIEVTSQGVVQHRHRFIAWDAAGFTNLAPEHIESHGSFEVYRAAKVGFFSYVMRSKKKKHLFAINSADGASSFFRAAVVHDMRATVIDFSRDAFVQKLCTIRTIRGVGIGPSCNTWIATSFNLENAACATSLAAARGVPWETIVSALDAFSGVPGRLEYVQREPFAVVVDYAHTPESLEAIYKTLKPKIGKLIGVLGSCGGGRDTWKRPFFGTIADKYCDEIILTEEDPYDEKPEHILSEIKTGIKTLESRIARHNFMEITNRGEAIKKAIAIAKNGDVVVITGKGSEPWIHYANRKKISWSDVKAAEEALKETINNP